jgi:hypothetical protein
MSTVVELQGSKAVWEPPPAKPLDEAVWQAWLQKGRAQDRQRGATRMKIIKWASIAVLFATAGVWSQLTPFEFAMRFGVVLGSAAVMLQSLHARHYASAAVFAALALLFNPVAPVFSFSGDWQRALVIACTFPFIVSLGLLNAKLAPNE